MGRERLLKQHLRYRFVVTLKSGETFDGLLDELDERWVELVDAAQIAADGSRLRVDGRLILPRAEVNYMQRPEDAR